MPPTYLELVARDGATNHWRLDETTGLLARDRIGGKDGTISGGVTLNQPGALADRNVAMTFNGTTGKIVTAANVARMTPFTVEAWVRFTSLAQMGILANPYVGGNEQTQLYLINGGLSLFFVNSAETLSFGAGGNRVINDGQWHHIVYRVQSAAVDFYVDGVLDVTKAPTYPLAGVNLKAEIGCSTNPATFLSGSLDEVAIYPTALTPAQIAQHYAAGYVDPLEVILRNKSGHAVLGYDEATATLSRLASGGLVAATPLVEPVCWNKSGDPVLGYLEPTDALVVLAGGGVAPGPAVLAPRTYDALIRRDGPSNYWRLDEATGLLARDSVGVAHGTISGGVTLNQQGALADGNPAMRFDGVTGQIATAAVVALPVTVTIEAWVKTSDPTGFRTIFAVPAGSGPSIAFATENGLLITYIAASTAGAGPNITDGRWHHVVLVITGINYQQFLDGAGSLFVSSHGAASDNLATIGRNPGGNFWNGSLDEVAIYPVALTPAQVAQHYAAGYGVFPTVEPVLRSKSGHAVLGYNEATDQLSVLCQGTL